ncbi:MAG: hypothetical protein COB36_11655 [Alphaproteobacteria bacterium]|nr:MAG: hypothetical protein COB36_11655 [Alphaproteobacteria bacterium]
MYSPFGESSGGGGGGGAGNASTFPNFLAITFSSSNFASKGAFFKPIVDITVSKVIARINADTTHTYKAGIYELNGSRVIQAVTGESATQVPASTAILEMVFPVADIVLLAGTVYYIGITRTDSTTTFSMPIATGNNASDEGNQSGMPLAPYAVDTNSTAGARVASVSPSVSDTILISGLSCFGVGIIGSF